MEFRVFSFSAPISLEGPSMNKLECDFLSVDRRSRDADFDTFAAFHMPGPMSVGASERQPELKFIRKGLLSSECSRRRRLRPRE